MDGKIITTVILQNPDGIWQSVQEFVNQPDTKDHAKVMLLGALQMIRMQGITDFRGDHELDNIPMNRVKNINVRIERATIQTGTLADLAALGGRQLTLPPKG